jgi:hypothetical protein
VNILRHIVKRIKRQATCQKKYLQILLLINGHNIWIVYPQHTKHLKTKQTKNQNNSMKNGKDLNGTSTKKICRWKLNTWEDAQNNLSLRIVI